LPHFRYDTAGDWFKGNVHLHTTFSDGGVTPERAAEMYADAGFDFLARTDHWAASRYADQPDRGPVVWLDGVELDGPMPGGRFCHVLCIGTFEGIDREAGLDKGIETVREQGGLVILAHPYWCGNTVEDALSGEFHGVEIYNHVCRWLNGKADGLYLWDAVLEQQPNVLGFAVDDAHLRPEHPGWNGGWIMVNAAAKARRALLASIKMGNFYSSCGPEFRSITCEGRSVTVRTSPVSHIRLVGPGPLGARVGSFEGETFTEATFDVPPDWETARIEIEDPERRRAWTNTLFAPDG
jgi:hypothetical protein